MNIGIGIHDREMGSALRHQMLKAVLLSTLFIIASGRQASAVACTSFAVFSNTIYYGMNFDFLDPTMKFLILVNGDMRVFHLAFERCIGQMRIFVNTVGMNTNGLFGACQRVFPSNERIPYSPEGDIYVHQLYDRIAEATDVEHLTRILDAAELLDLPGLELHNLFADTSGNAIVTECSPNGNAITKRDAAYMVMTNFANFTLDGRPYSAAIGKGAARYRLCHDYLRRNGHAFTIEQAFELLQMACNRDPDYPTNCSLVFDPQENEVFIALKRDFSAIYKVSIENGVIETCKSGAPLKTLSIPIGEEGLLVSDMAGCFTTP